MIAAVLSVVVTEKTPLARPAALRVGGGIGEVMRYAIAEASSF